MATTPFTLAALATSAVAGLIVTGARPHTSGSGGAFVSAVLDTQTGAVIVRVPSTPAAEIQQSAELLGVASLTEGARAQLPFALPATLGMTRARDTRAVVSTFLAGHPASMEEIESETDLLQGIAEAVAAIHSLPTATVLAGGLTVRDAEEVHMNASRLVQRAADTGMLPSTVRQRWQDVLDSPPVWSFEPTVVHGALAPENLLLEAGSLSGVLGWHELSLGDPAADLSWLLLTEPEVFESVLARYTVLRGVAGHHQLSIRARFYHELEVAKWLLHGFESHDQTIVDDAVKMFDHLVDRLSLIGSPIPKQRVLSEREVAQLLDETPVVSHDMRSETAEFESLDEDRAFLIHGDFDEPLQPSNSDLAGADDHVTEVIEPLGTAAVAAAAGARKFTHNRDD